MKKVLMVIGGITVFIVLAIVIIFTVVSATSKKLVCKSKEGNITLMYNKKTITGYTAKNISYDMEGQKEIASQIGIDEYIEQFSTWFRTNTTGTCEK